MHIYILSLSPSADAQSDREVGWEDDDNITGYGAEVSFALNIIYLSATEYSLNGWVCVSFGLT